MKTIEKTVDVQAPVSAVYDQWTQFESFPRFMEGVDRITQLDPTHTHWETNIGGVRREFDAEITEQHPEERIAWRSTDGPQQAGVVTFHRLDDTHTRVSLQMSYDPDTAVEKVGSALGVVSHRVQGDLENFREFIEHRDEPTGAWRGEVPRSPQQGEPNRGAPGGTAGNSVPPGGLGGGTQLP
ncbi:SRPBCC family protein [Labedaea rhizosphaerae]|uniref:Polyketide cyclase/dehydrase/lipid transport protein n=1 Tax=Labedaea rhizosphaerae TaxID=598644 RepID=A0A4R6SIZ5_LABRH|nr:SRPBCC family protein [Labedaea rhizosphaerae]TDQ00889.1 polyketide cyclase/dehydrase/lipid transport protein [Labedaea rhizosphaerae]